MGLIESFKRTCIFRMEENLQRIELCCDEQDEDKIWFKANEASNSIGNLILHLNGNISQYVISALGGGKDIRNRNSEFKREARIPKNRLLDLHAEIIASAIRIIDVLSEDDLRKEYKVQGFEMDGIEILVHVVEHYSYHTGQIALSTKLEKNKDLGFYAGINLDKLNN